MISVNYTSGENVGMRGRGGKSGKRRKNGISEVFCNFSADDRGIIELGTFDLRDLHAYLRRSSKGLKIKF